MSQQSENDAEDNIADLKNKMRQEVAALSSRQLKGRITKLCKQLTKFEEERIRLGLGWYMTWGHTELEVLLEFTQLLGDPKYEEMARKVLGKAYGRETIAFVETLIRGRRK